MIWTTRKEQWVAPSTSRRHYNGIVGRRRLWIIVGTVIALLLAFAFFPLTFEMHDLSGKPTVTLNGARVVRYGISRVRYSKTYFNAKDGVGDWFDCRCFVDIIEDGQERRIYGWRLTRRISRSPAAERRVVTFEIE